MFTDQSESKSMEVSLLDKMGFLEIIQRELFLPKSVWIWGDIAEKQFISYIVSFLYKFLDANID